ncbi:MAG: transglutaminase-like cysteine peptidase [Rhizobiaceae bacterium]|nr:transglutaminase-like cysteine peptidase [Hyphomicrobiales bacterium]NRB31228.1 transglutaminase-like cysteine peptidase [Rhizobiaceae bacterium]
MTTFKKTIMAATMIFAGTLTPTLSAYAAKHMPTGGRTSQPIGHAYFCEQLPQECQVRSRQTSAPVLTRKRWADLVEVNNYSNRAVAPVTDLDYYGVEEHWTYPKSYGDCEDYVLLKRYMLLQRGWPASSLLITVVKQPNGDGHAVLTVRTDRADFVLDNLDNKIKQWDKTSYRFLKRQSVKHTGHWTKIHDRRVQVARY